MLLMVPLAFALSCLLVKWVRQHIAHTNEQAQQPALTSIRLLGNMLNHIRAHRDLCTGDIEDQAAQTVKIGLIQKDIASSIEKISTITDAINRDERWIGMVEHWQRLSVHYPNLELESSVAQHNRLLSNLLRIIEERALDYGFDSLVDEISVLDKSWDSLLSLADHINQAHALGRHAVASGLDLLAHKLRLGYLKRNMQNSLQPGHLSPVIESALRPPVEAFMACIDELLVDPPPPIVSTRYFRLANEATDVLHAQFVQQVERLQQAIALLAEEPEL